MKDLGIEETKDDEGDVNYEADQLSFYDDEVKTAVTINTSSVKMGPVVKKECIEFDKLMADCEAVMNRKDHLRKL